jgi:methyltransferase (TIGR00027 family)
MPAAEDDLSDVHRTAFPAAALRAAHAAKGAEPKIFRDDLAMRLLPISEAEVFAIQARVPAASAATAILRSRVAEDRLEAARARLNQYVVLGAGLDSYALRKGESLGALIVYEVDDPPFQRWKRARIDEVGLKAPPQLRFAPCDFERMSVSDALAAVGFDADAPCFISWLGVMQYLTREAAMETLRWAGARAKGSEIVFTFLEYGQGADANRPFPPPPPGVKNLMYNTPEEVSGMLREAGFSRIEHFTEEEANAKFFQNRADGLRAPSIQRLAFAAV